MNTTGKARIAIPLGKDDTSGVMTPFIDDIDWVFISSDDVKWNSQVSIKGRAWNITTETAKKLNGVLNVVSPIFSLELKGQD